MRGEPRQVSLRKKHKNNRRPYHPSHHLSCVLAILCHRLACSRSLFCSKLGHPRVLGMTHRAADAPCLLLDIGGVLTSMHNTGKRYAFDALVPGALAYLTLHVRRWGTETLCICSRINGGEARRQTCWGWRVLEDVGVFSVLGLDRDRVRCCEERREKGSWARRFRATHVIDDNCDCLYACTSVPQRNCLLFGARGAGAGRRHPFHRAYCWEDVSVFMGFQATDFHRVCRILGEPFSVPQFQARFDMLGPPLDRSSSHAAVILGPLNRGLRGHAHRASLQRRGEGAALPLRRGRQDGAAHHGGLSLCHHPAPFLRFRP